MFRQFLLLALLCGGVLSFPFTTTEPALQAINSLPKGPKNRYPRRVIAGVPVVDTPLVRSAMNFAKENSQPWVYNHIMRSWLIGTMILEHNATLWASVDAEVQAVAALLHDLGWDRRPDSPFVTKDRRFEVDGAIAARDFIHSHKDSKKWDERRVQLVWDAIAFHTESSYAYYKETDIQVTVKGIELDFLGAEKAADFGIPVEAYAKVANEFPEVDLKGKINDTMLWLCRTKPSSTWDTYAEPWGDKYIANYTSQKVNLFKTIHGN